MSEGTQGTGAPAGGGAPGAGGQSASADGPTQQMQQRLDQLEQQNTLWQKRYDDLRAEFNRRISGQGAGGGGGGRGATLEPSPVAGGEDDLLTLLESDPARAVYELSQRLIPQLAPVVDARFRAERAYNAFVSDPTKGYRRHPRFSDALDRHLRAIYTRDPTTAYEQALDQAEPMVLEELRSLAGIVPPAEPAAGPAPKGAPKGAAASRTRPPETPPETAEGVGGAGTPGGTSSRQAQPPPDDEQARGEYLEEMEKTRVPGFPEGEPD